jgi:hypothetical protein
MDFGIVRKLLHLATCFFNVVFYFVWGGGGLVHKICIARLARCVFVCMHRAYIKAAPFFNMPYCREAIVAFAKRVLQPRHISAHMFCRAPMCNSTENM